MSTIYKLTFFAWLLLLLTGCRDSAERLPTLTPAPTPLADLQTELEQLYPPYYNGLALWGGYLYFGYGNELIWLDVRDPAQPILAGQLTLTNRISRLKLQDGQLHALLSPPDGYSSAFLADGWQQLDLTDPSRPQPTTFFDAPIPLHDVLIHRGIAYLGANTEIIRLDMTDPTAPRTLSPITGFYGNLSNLALYEPYLLASEMSCFRSCTTHLYLVDPRLSPDEQIISHFTQYGGFRTLIMHPPFLTHVGNGIFTLELTDPANPQIVQRWEYQGFFFSGLRQDNRLYLLEQGLKIVDLEAGEEPQVVAHLLSEVYLTQVAVDGSLVAMLGAQDGVYLFTLEGDAATPQLIAHYQWSAGK
ncbi:MAG: hypothetical protein KJ063_18695 [Anaerolineae bacterium]|nr:hypothetical protein [Anaerolineae bacterium]